MNGKQVLFIITIAFWVVVGYLFVSRGYENTWRLWNIPTMSPSFADTRVITAGAESRALGYDPLFRNPRDPWGRQMNYPRIWQLAFRLGVTQRDTVYIAVVFIALFFVGVFIFTDEIDVPTAILLSLMLYSPAVLLGMERGNNDLLIFFLLALALASLRKSGILGSLLVVAASVLKLFPIVGLSCLLREGRRRFLVLASFGCLIFLLYALLSLNDLKQIYAVTSQDRAGYGVNAVPLQLERFLGSPSVRRGAATACYAFAALVLLLALVANWGRGDPPKGMDIRHIDAFRVGASIFICTFMLGTNCQYRLMFVILALPQITRWGYKAERPSLIVSRLTLSALAVCCWWLLLYRICVDHFRFGKVYAYMVGDVCSWLALGGLAYLFFASLPEWVNPRLWRFGGVGSRPYVQDRQTGGGWPSDRLVSNVHVRRS
jgi:hypothetical protein